MTPKILAAALALLPCAAGAQDIRWQGFLDLRVVAAADERAWPDGGIGKTRYGDGGIGVHASAAALIGRFQFTPALSGYLDVQVHDADRANPQLVEAYARYRPVSTTPWRWALKAGVFFPPISLENDAMGWTSPWTLTPSAINAWVGEELRAIGGEFALEHRGANATWEGRLGVFGGNDPAGELLAARGWSLSDVNVGLGGRIREPDAYAEDDDTPPLRYDAFLELDDRPGAYADLTWRSRGGTRVSVMRYDNFADPTLSTRYEGHRTFAWRTRFWSVGWQTRIGSIELLAQGMTGDTVFKPSPRFTGETEFHAGYLLAGRAEGIWRPAVRVDFFTLRDVAGGPVPLSEHGNALTAALAWRPNDHLRITAELLRTDSWRMQRVIEARDPREVDTQVQLGLRWFY
ncbi:hypothetical protein ACQQ2N_03575 [Dokdonella sp. MW10]|uniref:hypothetical protein n=1 Tax=Dokdonella sp. MW10 TaxID=2992926 RepID=UPI003F8231F7